MLQSHKYSKTKRTNMEFKQDLGQFSYEPPGGRRSRTRVPPQQGVILTRIIRKDGEPTGFARSI